MVARIGQVQHAIVTTNPLGRMTLSGLGAELQEIATVPIGDVPGLELLEDLDTSVVAVDHVQESPGIATQSLGIVQRQWSGTGPYDGPQVLEIPAAPIDGPAEDLEGRTAVGPGPAGDYAPPRADAQVEQGSAGGGCESCRAGSLRPSARKKKPPTTRQRASKEASAVEAAPCPRGFCP